MQLIETPKAGERREYEMLVGGEWTGVRSGKTFESINPYTGWEWATISEADEEVVDRAVCAAREAFDEGPVGKMNGTERTGAIDTASRRRQKHGQRQALERDE